MPYMPWFKLPPQAFSSILADPFTDVADRVTSTQNGLTIIENSLSAQDGLTTRTG